MNDVHIDLSALKRANDRMVAKNAQSWNNDFFNYYIHSLKDYKPEEILDIINSGSITAQQDLSRNYFDKNGFYKQIILYYATVLNYSGLLIPNPIHGKQLSSTYLRKRLNTALNYLEKVDLVSLFTRISISALVYGSYYGIIQTLDKDTFVIFDLPSSYSRSNLRDFYGNDIVEFNVSYFNTIIKDSLRAEALATYPSIISSYYKKYINGEVTEPWVRLPADVGICFTFYDDGRPLFLNVIPATIQYDEAVDTERERELEEIRKIIVQKIPHLTDGQLLFEPPEAAEMHVGAVNMMSKNKNLSVLTTYADVDSIISKTSADNVSNSLDKMLQNVYANAGVSGQLFAPTGSQAIPYSIKNDISLMMILGNKYASFVTYLINTLFANQNIEFKYLMLPVGEYNKSEYVNDTLKLAQNGYSFLLPAIAAGLNQFELINIKSVENDVLNLQEVLRPLSNSYNQSSASTGEVGAPEKNLEDKSPKTIQNEDAIDHQGGSNE